MRRSSVYVLVVIVMAIAFGLCAICPGYAAEQTRQENKAVRFFKNVFNWPFSVTKKAAEAVGKTTKEAAMTVTKTGSSAVQTVTGKPEKIKDVVVEPIRGSVETAKTAVVETVKAPIEGTEEAFDND